MPVVDGITIRNNAGGLSDICRDRPECKWAGARRSRRFSISPSLESRLQPVARPIISETWEIYAPHRLKPGLQTPEPALLCVRAKPSGRSDAWHRRDSCPFAVELHRYG